VWTVNAQDLVIIGELLLTGKYNPERIVSLTGSSVKKPKYYKTRIGAEVSTFIYDSGLNEENVRVISGDVLTGTKIALDRHLGAYDTTVTIIPEGDDYEFFGWNKPVFDKISTSRAMTFSWLFPKKKYDLTANTNGEHRAFVMTGGDEKVLQLANNAVPILKACMVETLDVKYRGTKMAPASNAFHTFLYMPNMTTESGSHIRAADDLKRTMNTVIMALVPVLLFGIFNTGYQHYAAIDAANGITREVSLLENFLTWENFSRGALKVLLLVLISYGVGLGIEFIFAIIYGHEVEEGYLVTGMLVPLIVPVDIPLWMLVIAIVF